MLASLARKLLMKCALGAFAAAAAERRGVEAYVRRVWSRNRAPAVRVAFETLRNVAARMRQLCDVADDAVELRLRKRCADVCDVVKVCGCFKVGEKIGRVARGASRPARAQRGCRAVAQAPADDRIRHAHGFARGKLSPAKVGRHDVSRVETLSPVARRIRN